jgi:hypothetical protein
MSIHEAAIRILKRDYPVLKTAGFRRSVCTLEILGSRSEEKTYPDLTTYRPDLADPDADWDGKIDWEGYRKWGEPPVFRRVPDGYFFDFNTQMVVVFEVEDTSRLDIQKLTDYYYLYYEHLDVLGWGLALIGVDRWGSKKPVPFFDYVFSEMLTNILEGTPLAAVQSTVAIEHKFAVAACKPMEEWDDAEMFDIISGARKATKHQFWRENATKAAFEKIFRER